MRSPGFPGLPRPTGERAPAAQGKARARSVAASLTPEGQSLRVPGCSTPPRSSRDFLGAPSRDYSILRLPQPLHLLLAGAQGQSGPPLSGSFPEPCLCAAPGPDSGPEPGWRPGHRRCLSVTPGRGGRGAGRACNSALAAGKRTAGLRRVGSHPFLRALRDMAAQPGPEDTGGTTEPHPAALAHPGCLLGIGFQEPPARASQRRKCSLLLFGRLGERAAGSPGSAASRKGHSQSALGVGPALTPRPALRPGTPTWPKFLDGSEAGTSPTPALQALHHAAVEDP